jgi:hypothetical protein
MQLAEAIFECLPLEFANFTWREGTVLCIAAANGNCQIVDRLLTSPSLDRTIANSLGETTFVVGAKHHHLSIAKLLVPDD